MTKGKDYYRDLIERTNHGGDVMSESCTSVTLDCLEKECYLLIGCVQGKNFERDVDKDARRKVLDHLLAKKYSEKDSCFNCWKESRKTLEKLLQNC